MKLKDKISELDSDTYIYIGCKDGSSFFFIGTPEEFGKLIGKINMETTSVYSRSIHNYEATAQKCNAEKEEEEAKLKAIADQEEAYREDVQKELKFGTSATQISRIIKTEKAHVEILEQMRKSKESISRNTTQALKAQKKAKELNELIRKWIPFEEREILEEYPHTVEPAGITLLVDGKVEGNYWLRSEFEIWMKKEKEAEEGESMQ